MLKTNLLPTRSTDGNTLLTSSKLLQSALRVTRYPVSKGRRRFGMLHAVEDDRLVSEYPQEFRFAYPEPESKGRPRAGSLGANTSLQPTTAKRPAGAPSRVCDRPQNRIPWKVEEWPSGLWRRS